MIRMYFTKTAFIFGLTGLFNAVIVGDGLLFLLKPLLPLILAVIIVAVTTKITDYLLKAYVVFRRRAHIISFGKYQVGNAVSLGSQVVFTPLLADLGVDYLIAYIIAVFIGWVLKYPIARWAFK